MSIMTGKPLAGTRIMVAEDNAILAFDIVCTLRDAGAETLGPALTLRDAEALATMFPLDCAVLDISLRQDLIFPVAAILRQKGVGIVFHTGYGEIQAVKRDWPDAQVLIKPVSPRVFLQAVLTACRRC